MEATFEAQQNKKMERLKLYAGLWAIFMAFVFAPALFCTATIQGETFTTSLDLVAGTLIQFGAPHWLAYVLHVPVTIVATVLPAETSALLMPLLFLWPWAAVLVPMLICGAAEMPFYREMKSRIDPDWYEKEMEGVIVKPKFSRYPFAKLVAILLIGTAIAFWFAPNSRTVIADDFKGQVYIADSRGKLTPIDVQLNLKVYDPGYIHDRKPGVNNASLRMEFSGSGVDKLKALGINDNFIEGRHDDRTFYPNQLCEINKAVAVKDKRSYDSSLSFFEKSYLLNTIDNVAGGYSNDLGCPKNMHIGIFDFDNVQFAINGPTDDRYLVANLKRDTRWGMIEKARLSADFAADPKASLEHSSLGAPFGYR